VRVELEELVACQSCGERMVFKGKRSPERFVSGYLSCANDHLFQVKEEIGLLKDAKLSADEFEWKVDVADEKKYDEIRRQYDSFLGEERRDALEKLRGVMIQKIAKSSVESDRVVLDVASGMGTFILPLAAKSEEDLRIIGTDVDEKPLRGALNKARKAGVYGKMSLVVTDAKHLAFRTGALGCVSSFFGFDNVPHASVALKEAARVLCRGGKVVFCSLWYEERSKSVGLADAHGVGELANESRMKKVLDSAGFVLQDLNVVYSGVWPHNPMDLLPVEGDRYEHVVIEATKA
jgi:ubiquinone/menaquinone biosynthesis C-methylase UbiE